MAASQSGVFTLQLFTDAGALAVNYRLYTYTAGTTTHKTAYTDSAAAVPHTYTNDGIGGQYIALNSRGELPAPLFLASGAYDICLKTTAGATVWTRQASPTLSLADIPAVQSPFIGGSLTSSVAEIRSTSGAGTSLPATTTDYVRFTRGNNGAQELGRFTPGGSFGVGDFTDGQVPNVHAGDDGTGTRVATVRAKTAALFIGATDRTNAESGGPVGRSVASFEGYRLANQSDSRESGALRVVTEGVSANQLGSRVSVLTRRDGFTESDFLERWWISNDGSCYHGNGSGVGGPNRGNYAYGNVVHTISGSTGRAVLELTTSQADADGTILGDVVAIGNFQTTNKSVVLLQSVLAGTTATDRGGELRVYIKKDGSTLAERMRFTADALRLDVPIGGLSQAPTLTITSNTIVPTKPISFVGAGLIKTITAPVGISGAGGQITLIPTAAFTTDTTGNLAIASTAVIGRAMTLTYDGGTAKWYPAY